MKLSTRGRYATRAMFDLAANYQSKPITLGSIAQRQEISVQYLEQLIGPLKVAGLVSSMRGPNGGFTLTKPPSEIKVSDIIQIVEGSTAPVECVDIPEICRHSDNCPTRGIWVRAKQALDNVFESITLQDLIDEKTETMLPSGSMYHI